MKIGLLARQAGIAVNTVRFYEREGLLPPANRRPSGYRDYDAADVARLRFVRRAKALGFTLVEIGDLLPLSDQRDGDMSAMNTVAHEKLVEVEQRLVELMRIRDALRALLEACPGHGAMTACPIRAALAGEWEPAADVRSTVTTNSSNPHRAVRPPALPSKPRVVAW